MEPLHVGISGLIGVGKTTLAEKLGPVLGLPVFYEPVIDNEYLDRFYSDMKSHSFSFQIYLLNRRFEQQQKLIWNNEGGIQDRTIYEDTIFARMLMNMGMISEIDYNTYLNLFKIMSRFMNRPNLIIHLDITPEESLRRIKERNRECEKSITLEYLQELYNNYEIFLNEISKSIRVIRVDWNSFMDVDDIARMIKNAHETMKSVYRI